MNGVRAFACFCEDVRRESAGKDTIIGLMTDTRIVPSFPWSFRRMAVYFQIKLDVDKSYDQPLLMDLESSESELEHADRSPAPLDMIERAIAKAKQRGLPFATITGRVQFKEPMLVPEKAKIYAVLKYGEERDICAVLNVIERPKDDSTASSRPPLQSPSDD
jgi:hypothetical protein